MSVPNSSRDFVASSACSSEPRAGAKPGLISSAFLWYLADALNRPSENRARPAL